jgi:hypothetical protein
VSRPGKFSAELGKHDGKWTNWSFTFLNFMVCISPDYEEELEQAGNVKNPIASPQDPAILHRSRTLYAIMASLFEGKALAVLKSVKQRNGYEAWRQIIDICEPKNKGRNLALLMAVTQADSLANAVVVDFVVKLLAWEQTLDLYEQTSGVPLQDEVKRAVVMRHVPETMKQQVTFNAEKFTTYKELRDSLMLIIDSHTTWTSNAYDGVSPMDVGYTGYSPKGGGKGGKNKEKDKGGKDKGKGKDKGGKDKDKGKGKGKDKSGKDKGKVKGKHAKGKPSKRDTGSFVCGDFGHMARDCPKSTRGNTNGIHDDDWWQESWDEWWPQQPQHAAPVLQPLPAQPAQQQQQQQRLR